VGRARRISAAKNFLAALPGAGAIAKKMKNAYLRSAVSLTGYPTNSRQNLALKFDAKKQQQFW